MITKRDKIRLVVIIGKNTCWTCLLGIFYQLTKQFKNNHIGPLEWMNFFVMLFLKRKLKTHISEEFYKMDQLKYCDDNKSNKTMRK